MELATAGSFDAHDPRCVDLTAPGQTPSVAHTWTFSLSGPSWKSTALAQTSAEQLSKVGPRQPAIQSWWLRQLSVSLEIDRGLVMFSDVLCPFSLCGGDLREKNTIPGPVHSNLRWRHGKGTVANDCFKSHFIQSRWSRVVLWPRFFISDHPREATRPSLRALFGSGALARSPAGWLQWPSRMSRWPSLDPPRPSDSVAHRKCFSSIPSHLQHYAKA